MFEQFDQVALKVIIVAREEAARLRHEALGAEHILLALIVTDDAAPRSRLKALSPPPELKEIEKQLAQVLRQTVKSLRAKEIDKLGTLSGRERVLRHRKDVLTGRDRHTVVTTVLQRVGVPIDTLHTDLGRALVGLGVLPKAQFGYEIPFTQHAKRGLELGIEEAHRLGDDYVTPVHLLLGLLTEGRSKAAKIVASFAVDADSVRREFLTVRKFLGGTPSIPQDRNRSLRARPGPGGSRRRGGQRSGRRGERWHSRIIGGGRTHEPGAK